MTHRTGFHDGRLGIGLKINGGGDGSGKPRYPLDVNGDIRLSGAIVDISGNPIQMMAQQRTFPNAITNVEKEDIGDGTVFGAGTFKLNGLDTYYTDGNVGIGTTDPGSYKLYVNGKGYFSQIDILGGDIQGQINTKQNNLTTNARLNANCIGDNSNVSNTEYGYLNGVTSAIQTQINSKQAEIGGAASSITSSNLTVSRALVSDTNGKVAVSAVTSTELGYLDGVTSAIQTQLSGKASTSSIHWSKSTGYLYYNGGNVGIGTTSPGSKLTISHTRPTSITNSGDFYLGIGYNEHNNNSYRLIGFGYLSSTANVYPAYIGWVTTDNGGSTKGDLVFGTRDSTVATTVPSERMRIKSNGKVGIGMSPGYQLDVNGSFRHTSHMELKNISASPRTWAISHYFNNNVGNGGFIAVKDERTRNSSPYGDGASLGLGEKRQGTYYLGIQLREYTCYASTSGLSSTTISDNRIKKDIEDVPDNYALQKVRDLPCRYYNYKHEPKNGEHKVVGFIAQEVKQHLPGCVNEGEMPTCMPTICEFVNVTWEKIGVDEIDPSKNVFKIKCDEFEKYSNQTHRFYFSNDGSKNHENVLIRETPKEEDNSFIIAEIDEPYDYVYVYGASQSDFLTIKKDQIFALHHSAIQELDRLQQTDKEKIAELETKVSTLENELAAIKTHLGL